MEYFDCIFVHVPNLSNFYLPSGSFANNNLIPMGVLAMSNLANRKGYKTEVVHMGVERLSNPEFSLIDFLKNRNVKTIGLSLFWYHQSYDVIELARLIKNHYPDIFVFLGGLTSSYFAEEILKEFQFIDAVIKGYGEIPLLSLLKQYTKNDSPKLNEVPNLVYRDDKIVKTNIICPVDKDIFSELVYADLSVVRNHDIYINYFGLHEMPVTITDITKLKVDKQTKMFPLCVGRGCDVVCSYCGGNKNVWEKTAGKNYLVWRQAEAVLEDIRKAKSYGYNKMFICFDPTPSNQVYYVNLFRLIRQENLDISMYFECWGLPTLEFIKEFSKSFSDELSHILLSIDTASEELRFKHRGHAYTNEQLFVCLHSLEEYRVHFDVCLSLGLPGGSVEEAMETKKVMHQICKDYKYAGRVMAFLIDLVPGSPMFENPEKFNIETKRKKFLDYYNAFSETRNPTYAFCNYKINNYFDDERDNGTVEDFARQIQHLKCMDFCFIGGKNAYGIDPEMGRKVCLESRNKVFSDLGIKLKPKVFSENYRYSDELCEFERVCEYQKRIKYR